MNIRKFKPADARFCFKTRANPFIQKFNGELSPEAVSAGVNAYMPEDYIQMSKEMEFFIAEENQEPVAFFTIKRLSQTAAEIPLIYVDMNHLGKGLGSICIRYIVSWIRSNWKEIRELVVETVIPDYNSDFYQRMGFIPSGETTCEFPDMSLKAQRLIKAISETNEP